MACADLDPKRATALAETVEGCAAFTDWHAMVARIECDLVIVATRHDSLAQITKTAVERGLHVLVEKARRRLTAEIEPVIVAARCWGSCVRRV